MRIALIGKAGSGKSTASNYLHEAYGFKRYGFADRLKELAVDLFGMKEKDRLLLQELGTKIREIRSTVWIDYVLKQINTPTISSLSGIDDFVISDCRYLNEAEILRKNGFTLIRLVNTSGHIEAIGMNEQTKQHPSETEQDLITPDYTIEAESVLVLKAKLERVLDDIEVKGQKQ